MGLEPKSILDLYTTLFLKFKVAIPANYLEDVLWD